MSRNLGFLRRKQYLIAWTLAAISVPILIVFGRPWFIAVRDFVDLQNRIDWVSRQFYDMGTNGYIALMAIGMVSIGLMTLQRTTKS